MRSEIDIAAAIAFLADSASSGFVNGVTLTVDGGWTLASIVRIEAIKQRLEIVLVHRA